MSQKISNTEADRKKVLLIIKKACNSTNEKVKN